MDILVSTDWLADNLATVTVLDASRHLAAAGRDPASEFAGGHIPGARFLDLGSLEDRASPVPSALPTAAQFAERLAALGVEDGSRVVLYDDSDLRSSARAWFLFRLFGWSDVALLDGGLKAWRAAGHTLDTGGEQPAPVEAVAHDADPARMRDKAEMLANIDSRAEQVVDARDAGRFTGAEEDTVHGLPGGHIPGARNLHYPAVLNHDGTFKRGDDLRAAFVAAGIDLDHPVVATCGSGVTASVLLFALELLGKTDTALYDGSWSEWGADPATPKETGAAR
ncbi:sulfurtransferase [Pelagerythrobacter sp.]|uniref:sulfurtransferase n=1 Tax=Pelagerythrobacter sp. TaxID=2800702 RepID=UPI0035ADF3FC